jgi:phosphoenolpyruvate carboxylase
VLLAATLEASLTDHENRVEPAEQAFHASWINCRLAFNAYRGLVYETRASPPISANRRWFPKSPLNIGSRPASRKPPSASRTCGRFPGSSAGRSAA